MSSTSTTTTPRIYVACLASYNNGVLHGEWIDADQDTDAIQEEVNAMLRASRFPNVQVACPECPGMADDGEAVCALCKGSGEVPSAEEWAIHDFEGFEGIRINEYDSFERVSKLAELLEEHGEAFAIWHENFGPDDLDIAGEQFQEAYAGEARDEAEYASNYLEDTGMLNELPDWARNYFDFEAYGRDMRLSGDFWFEGGYVFRSNC